MLDTHFMAVKTSRDRKKTGLPKISKNCLGIAAFILLPLPPANRTTPTFDKLDASVPVLSACREKALVFRILLLTFKNAEVPVKLTSNDKTSKSLDLFIEDLLSSALQLLQLEIMASLCLNR